MIGESLSEGLHDGLTGVTAVDDDMNPMRSVHAAIQDFELSKVHAFIVSVERFHGGWITKELRPAEDPNGFDLFLNRGRVPVKTWENRILGLVCYIVGLGGFCLPCYKTGVFRASGGLFARLHVFGVAAGPLRMCVIVCMHEHHL